VTAGRRWRTKGAERKSECLSIPVSQAVMFRIENLAAARGVPKTELARAFVMAGLEAAVAT
jgi:hypothetical protein